MQQFKSPLNTERDLKAAKKQEQRRGEITFELDANMSGKIITKFPKPFEVLPFILTNTLVSGGSEFGVTTVLTNVTISEFAVNIQNLSDEPVKGSVFWVVM